MKELVEKINALYAEFEKDATAQAEKGKPQAREQEKFHSLLRRNLRILERHHSRQENNSRIKNVRMLTVMVSLFYNYYVNIGSLRIEIVTLNASKTYMP